MKEINIAGLALKVDEIEVLKRLGFDVVVKKEKTKEKAHHMPKTVKPYLLEQQVTCSLCGEKFSLFYRMESVTKFCLKGSPLRETPKEKPDKVETRKWKRCGSCSSNLEKLSKQEIITKLLWYNKGI